MLFQCGLVLCFVVDLLKQLDALLQALITYSSLRTCILLFGHKRLYGQSAQDIMMTH